MKKLIISLLVIMALVFSFSGKVSAVDVPAIPMPVIPVNGAIIETDYPMQVTLVWAPVTGATSYNVMFAAASDFVIPIFSSMTTANQQGTPSLSYGVTYYWKVQAVNVAGVSPWSAIQSFSFVPRAPILTLPVNGAVFYLGSQISLSWQYSPPYPSWFGFMTEVAYEPTFSEPYIVARGVTTANSFFFNPPSGVSTYYWRVKVNTSVSSPWSEVRVFRVTPPLLTIPILTNPSYNALITNNEVTLSWSTVPYASLYQIQVQGLTTLDQIYSSNSFSMTLASGQRYTWRVRAGNVYGWGQWSSWSPFRCLLTPGVVTLTAPTNDFTFKKTTGVTLTWQNVATATSYQVCITDEVTGQLWSFNPTVPSLAVQTEYNHYYSWKVAAINAAGQGIWSTIWHFSVLDMTPPELSVNTLPEWTNQSSMTISGRATDVESGIARILINGTLISADTQGNFSYILPLSEGINYITVVAYDQIGNMASKQVMTKMDTIPPEIIITRPFGSNITVIDDITVMGKIVDVGGIKSLSINNDSVIVESNGSFSYPIQLNYGPNKVYLLTTDFADNQTKITLEITKVERTITFAFQVGNPKMTITQVGLDGELHDVFEEIDHGRGTIPLIRNDRVFIPVRKFVEILGGDVLWDPVSRKITIRIPGSNPLQPAGKLIQMELWIDKSVARVTDYNGTTRYVDIEAGDKKVVPFISNGRSYFPLRFIVENFGLTSDHVQWYEELQMVKISYPLVP
jgi:hypothetical protein